MIWLKKWARKIWKKLFGGRAHNTNPEPITGIEIVAPPALNAQSGEPAQQKFIRDVVFLMLTVMFIGFALMFVAVGGILIDSWNNKAASYDQLQEKVQEQNVLLELMAGKLKVQIPSGL